jgi:hypothetical protein
MLLSRGGFESLKMLNNTKDTDEEDKEAKVVLYFSVFILFI